MPRASACGCIGGTAPGAAPSGAALKQAWKVSSGQPRSNHARLFLRKITLGGQPGACRIAVPSNLRGEGVSKALSLRGGCSISADGVTATPPRTNRQTLLFPVPSHWAGFPRRHCGVGD